MPKTKVEIKVKEATDVIDDVCSDKSVSRAQYREFLQEIVTYCEASLECLDEDDKRDARLAREAEKDEAEDGDE